MSSTGLMRLAAASVAAIMGLTTVANLRHGDDAMLRVAALRAGEVRAVKPDAPFDTMQLGVTGGAHVWVRALAGGTAITRWNELHAESQLSLPQHADALELQPVGAAIDAVTLATSVRLPPPVVRSNSHVVVVPAPAITTRQQWGARPATQPYELLVPALLTVHHTSSPLAADYHGASTIKGIQDYHIDGHGWADIGYHYVIGPDGVIFEGRPEWALGAHSPPNDGKLGICVVGDFQNHEQPTAKALDSLEKLLAHLAGKYAIEGRAIFGHRDFNETDCCGDALYTKLPGLRTKVTQTLAYYTQHPLPPPPTTPGPPPQTVPPHPGHAPSEPNPGDGMLLE